MKLKSFWLAALIPVTLSLTGCGLFSFFETNPYHPVCYFDLGAPSETDNLGIPGIQINPVLSEGPYGPQMAFRSGEYQVEFDDYNRWSQEPNKMTRRYLVGRLNGGETAAQNAPPTYCLDAALIDFIGQLSEKDSEKGNYALFTISVTLRDMKTSSILWQRIFTEKAPMDNRSATAFAKAMSQAVDRATRKIRDQILATENAATTKKAE